MKRLLLWLLPLLCTPLADAQPSCVQITDTLYSMSGTGNVPMTGYIQLSLGYFTSSGGFTITQSLTILNIAAGALSACLPASTIIQAQYTVTTGGRTPVHYTTYWYVPNTGGPYKLTDVPTGVVNVSGSPAVNVTWESGLNFAIVQVNDTPSLNGVSSISVASVQSATQMTLSSSPGSLTGATFSDGPIERAQSAPGANPVVFSQAIFPSQIVPSQTNGNFLMTQNGVTQWAGPTVGNYLKQYSSIYHFGDSITCAGAGQDCLTNAMGGYDATSYLTSYVGIIDTAFGVSGLNSGVSGSQAADQEVYIYAASAPTASNSLYTYMIGTNDAGYTGLSGLSNFQLIEAAELAYLAIPQAALSTAQGSQCSYTGTWSSSGVLGKSTTTNGATASCPSFGDVVYIAYTVKDGNAGTFIVKVDGNQYGGTYNSYTSYPISTHLGVTSASLLIRIPNVSYGPHTVTLTVTSATGAGNVVQLDWIGGNKGFQTLLTQDVIAGGVPLQSSGGSVSNATVYAYTEAVKSNVYQLAGDGLNVFYADTTSDPNVNSDRISDHVHPNNAGHAQIAAQFLYALNSLVYPVTRSGAQQGGGLGSGNIVAPGPWVWFAQNTPYHQLNSGYPGGTGNVIGYWGQANLVLGAPTPGAQSTEMAVVSSGHRAYMAAGAYPRQGIDVDEFSHIQSFGTAPTASNCGSGTPTVTGTAWYGKVTIGAGGTGCTLTWAQPFDTSPTYAVVNPGGIIPTTITINLITFSGVAGTTYFYDVRE